MLVAKIGPKQNELDSTWFGTSWKFPVEGIFWNENNVTCHFRVSVGLFNIVLHINKEKVNKGLF